MKIILFSKINKMCGIFSYKKGCFWHKLLSWECESSECTSLKHSWQTETTCGTCDGKGFVRERKRQYIGTYPMEWDDTPSCNFCTGGKVIHKYNCNFCMAHCTDAKCRAKSLTLYDLIVGNHPNNDATKKAKDNTIGTTLILFGSLAISGAISLSRLLYF